MKKTLLFIFSIITLPVPALLRAQSFTMADTAIATVDSSLNVQDSVKINSGSAVTLKWRVISTTFPADWLTESAFGICDNLECYSNTGTGATNIWNGTSGNSFTTAAYAANSTGPYHLVLDLNGASSGTHTMTISVSDPSSMTSQTITFIITKPSSAAVPAVIKSDDVVLYPNPANSEINLVYDASADVKTIAVYNIIGKVMTIYKVTDNISANLNIDNLTSGIYFVRLMNSHGDVVVTKKFTKQ